MSAPNDCARAFPLVGPDEVYARTCETACTDRLKTTQHSCSLEMRRDSVSKRTASGSRRLVKGHSWCLPKVWKMKRSPKLAAYRL